MWHARLWAIKHLLRTHYECEDASYRNLFNPANQYNPENPLDPVNRYNPTTPFALLNRFR